MNIVVYILLIIGFGTGVLLSSYNADENKVTKEEQKEEVLEAPTDLDTTSKAKLIHSFTP